MIKNNDTTLLTSLFSFATEGIIISDKKGKIVMANPRAENLFGYDRGELENKSIEDLVPRNVSHKHVAYREKFNESPNSRKMGQGLDLYAKRKDDSLFPVEISLSNFSTENGDFVMSFIIDITERKKQSDIIKRTNERLKSYSTKLAASNAELEQFAYIASHDLQEPLRKIRTFGERLLLKEANNLTENGVDYLSRMVNASERMQKLINDLLILSRVTTTEKAFEKVDLNIVLQDVLTDLEMLIEKSKTTIKHDALPIIDADYTQMKQLFLNLISNAVKFSRNNEKPRVEILLKPSEKTDVIQLHFIDNGVGFESKYLDKIFVVFQRLNPQNFEGSGIGLNICKKIIDRHGGTITAISDIGKGAEFIIDLPIHQKDH